MSAVKNVWVFAEKQETLAELCAGGHQIGERVAALVIGAKSDAEQMAHAADQVYWLGEPDSARMLEDYVLTLEKLVADKRPDLLLVGPSKRARLLAGRLAARLGTAVLADVLEFINSGEQLQCKRMVYGGAGIRTEIAGASTVIATATAGIFNTAAGVAGLQGLVESVDFIKPGPGQGLRRLERRAKGGAAVNLAAAKRVIAVGRGLARQEDLAMVKEFAALIGAELGCTRPLAEGVNWLPRERYIGVSGVMFKPELYIGIGISGQVQHMVGCDQAGTIFAINKDKTAPIFTQADYGVIGDLYKIIPALIEKIKGNTIPQ